MSHKLSQDIYERILLFQGAGRESIDYILDQSRILELPEGHLLISPEKKSERIYILLKGEVSIYLGGIDSDCIGTLEPGECVGEMSMIDADKASAWVTTSAPSTFLVLEHELVWSLLWMSHQVSLNLLMILTQRMRFNNQCIIEGQRRQEMLEIFSRADPLTGLFNRRWFDKMVTRHIERAHSDGSYLGLLLLDVDHFKQYNDSQGHLGGDYALVTLSRTMEKLLRPDDLACRYGGEEFVIVLPQSSPEDCLAIAERLRTFVERMEIKNGEGTHLPSITISVGMAMLTPGENAEQLTKRADQALYTAKAQGRNRVVAVEQEGSAVTYSASRKDDMWSMSGKKC